MKIIITESKVNVAILNYLKLRAYPDYDWGPHLHKFYKKDVDIHGSYTFVIDDQVAYTYYGDEGEFQYSDYRYELVMEEWLYDELTSLFRDLWVPIFKKWFEENTGLEIKEFSVEE
jgi:hypothetical protein